MGSFLHQMADENKDLRGKIGTKLLGDIIKPVLEGKGWQWNEVEPVVRFYCSVITKSLHEIQQKAVEVTNDPERFVKRELQNIKPYAVGLVVKKSIEEKRETLESRLPEGMSWADMKAQLYFQLMDE